MIRLEIRVGSIEVANGALEILVGTAALNGLPKLIERPNSALADLKSILHELLQKGQDLRERFTAHFGLLLKFADVKTKNRVLQYPAGGPLLRPLLRKHRRPGDL